MKKTQDSGKMDEGRSGKVPSGKANVNRKPILAWPPLSDHKGKDKYQFEWLMRQTDYAFAPNKTSVCQQEDIKTITNLKTKWPSLETKMTEIGMSVLRKSYIYVVCLGQYMTLLDKDAATLDVYYEEWDFHNMYLKYRLSLPF